MALFDVIPDPTFVGGDTRTFETSFSRIKEDCRLDANRFDPRYDEFFRRLRTAGTTVRLGEYLKEKPKRGVQPTYDANGEVYVINSQQVHADKIDLESCSMTTKELVAAKRNKGVVRKYDVLLNSTGYITIGRCQAYLYECGAIADSHITILRPVDSLHPVYLALFLNSRLGYLQTERSWTGSSGQIELRVKMIEDFMILLPSMEAQLEIRKQVEQAHAARQEARRLLGQARAMVESAILEG